MYKQRIVQLKLQYKNVFHYQHFVMCTRFDLFNVVEEKPNIYNPLLISKTDNTRLLLESFFLM